MSDLTPEEIKAFDGLEEANRKMVTDLEKISPICHMRKMMISEGDEYPIPISFWECSICGHTKDFSARNKGLTQ